MAAEQNTLNLRAITDYIIIKQANTFMATDIRTYRGAQYGSDHFLLKM